MPGTPPTCASASDVPSRRSVPAARTRGCSSRATRPRDAGRADAAIAAYTQAKALFPEYARGDGPYWRLAQVHAARGDTARAIAELQALTTRDASFLPALLELAALPRATRGQCGRSDGARAVGLDLAVRRLRARAPRGALRADGRRATRGARAPRHRRARACRPRGGALPAGARTASRRATGPAQREVLRALEEAPTFVPAQELLLTLVDGPARPGGTP